MVDEEIKNASDTDNTSEEKIFEEDVVEEETKETKSEKKKVKKLEAQIEELQKQLEDAALAATLFHYGELTVPQVKEYLRSRGVEVRK